MPKKIATGLLVLGGAILAFNVAAYYLAERAVRATEEEQSAIDDFIRRFNDHGYGYDVAANPMGYGTGRGPVGAPRPASAAAE